MSESSGSGLVDRGTRRRWLISAAIVVLLHAGLAVGVLTWRNMKLAPPVEIDLTRSSSDSGRNEAQAASQVLAAAPNKTDTASAGPPDQAGQSDSVPLQSMPSAMILPAERSGANQSAVDAGQGADSAEAASGMAAPQLPPSPQGVEAEMASAPVPNGLAAGGPRPSSPMANMPLDISITVQPPVRGNGAIGPLASRETGALDRTPMSEFRPAKPFGVPDIPRNGANGPHGAYVQDRAHAAMARSMGRAEAPKNAIGSSAMVVASRGDATGLNAGVTRNAIGVTANFRPRIPRANASENKIGITAAAGRAMPASPVINGRGFARSGTGPAMIGGPARASGALSGNDFHLRHR